MQSNTALLLWHLGFVTFRRYTLLKEAYGDMDSVVPIINRELLQKLGCKAETSASVLTMKQEFDAQKTGADMQKRRVQLCSIEDPEYPAILRELPDPPVFLSYIGDLSILEHPLIAVIGTRRMSGYGRRVVEVFVPSFVRSNVITVSGLALGVDAAVAKDTINAGGKTVAVLGHGLGTIHPRSNMQLAETIVQSGGLILSEYPLSFAPDIYTFPARNRIIAGLSLGTLVIEAPKDSGSIITAELALEYNREVFAVPGQIFDDHVAGCHALIAQGRAQLVTEPSEVLRAIGLVPSNTLEQTAFLPRTDDERVMYETLSGMPQSIDDLSLRTGLNASRIGTALTLMELDGVVGKMEGGMWIRK